MKQKLIMAFGNAGRVAAEKFVTDGTGQRTAYWRPNKGEFAMFERIPGGGSAWVYNVGGNWWSATLTVQQAFERETRRLAAIAAQAAPADPGKYAHNEHSQLETT